MVPIETAAAIRYKEDTIELEHRESPWGVFLVNDLMGDFRGNIHGVDVINMSSVLCLLGDIKLVLAPQSSFGAVVGHGCSDHQLGSGSLSKWESPAEGD